MPRLLDEVSATMRLKESLLANYPDLAEDDQTLWNTIEGETDIVEALSRVVSSALDDEDMVEAIKARKDALNARQTRFKARAESKRSAVKSIMELLAMPKIERPEFTVSVGKKAASLIVTDESKIPAGYFKAADPVLDKKLLADDLKNGARVEGAELSNGGTSLIIRTR